MPVDNRWLLATSLLERVHFGAPAPTPGGVGFDRLEELEQEVFGEGDHNDVYRSLGFTRGILAGLLQEGPDDLGQRIPPPEWASDLHRLLQAHGRYRGELPEVFEHEDWRRKVAAIAWPLLLSAKGKIAELVRAVLVGRHVPHGAGLQASLLDLLTVRVANFATRVVVHEVHDSHADFDDYISALQSPDAIRTLLLKYPQLARELMRVYHSVLEMIAEVLERFAEDWTALGLQEGILQRVVSLASDPHNHGREVLCFEFGGPRLIYKPRSCAAEAVFFRRIMPYIEPDLDPRLVSVKLRDGYSWMSFVDHPPCRDEAEVDGFFQRAGRLLAVAYFFGITDLHSENLVALGGVPIPVDLETMLHPESVTFGAGPNRADSKFSLFDTMLLPGVQRGLAVDMGGLASTDRRLSTPLPVWERDEENRLRVVNKPTRLAARMNLPHRGLGEQALPEHHFHALATGLALGYNELLADRGTIEEILAELSDVPMRTVLRPTAVYMQLLADCRHPSLLVDALQCDTWRLQLGTAEPDEPLLLTTFPAEWRALARGDVPVFWTRGGSRDLFTHGESQRVAECNISGIERVRARLRSPLSLEQLQWQLHCGLVVGSGDPIEAGVNDGPDRSREPSPPLAKACHIGDVLLKLAISTDRGGLDWNTVRRDPPDDIWAVHILDSDLYDGLAGVALFLLYLGMATSKDAYREAGERALWEAFLRWKDHPGPRTGGYVGAGSVLYVLMHASRLSIHWAAKAIDEVLENIYNESGAADEDAPTHTDVLHGDAGLLLVVIRLMEYTRRCGLPEDVRHRKLALGLVGRLMDRTVVGNAGEVAWQPDTNFGKIPLCGLSHGASGIALALSEAARVLDEPKLRSTIEAALRYEDAHFDVVEGTWLNLVSADAAAVVGVPKRDLCSWCNGATGIGLVRQQLRSDGSYHGVDERLALDIERALSAMQQGLPGLVSDCLCHGTAGTLEVALQLCKGSARTRPDWLETALVNLGELNADTYACSNPLGVVTPGLMTGISGIGLFWLRIAEVSSIPCVLTLEGPC